MAVSDIQKKGAVRLLEWIKQYPGWWYLICTPGEEHMNLDMMRRIIRHLAQESLYEIVFVLLTVHRDAPFMKNFYVFSWLDCLIEYWDDDYKRIVTQIIKRFE